MTEAEDLRLLLEAPIDDAKRMRSLLVEAAISVSLVRPEACGRKA